MRVVIDVEANALFNPTKIWIVVCKDIDTGKLYVFRNLCTDEAEAEKFRQFSRGCSLIIGHNILGYDFPVLRDLVHWEFDLSKIIDTLVISKLANYPRKGHSVEDYGIEFGFEKIKHYDFSKFSDDLETYCIRDVDITHRIYNLYAKFINKPEHAECIRVEHQFSLVVNNLHDNGFAFNTRKAEGLLEKVTEELGKLDAQILDAFPPRLKLIREITPRETKHGTISLTSIPKTMREMVSDLNVDSPFSYCSWVSFNPSSHKQLIEVLNEAGWRPVDKTETHKDIEREYNQLRYKEKNSELDIRYQELYTRLQELRITGWKINEANLETLPPSAPHAARLLASRILLESRRRTLTEWLSLVSPSGSGTDRIHGKFYGIGAWTHRMAHQNPNTANIPNEFDTSGKKKLFGKELRSLWCAPKNRLLVGVDAEGIQLRIFAHYINDPEFTEALINGKKEDKTDPHSLNQRILGTACKSRAAAKRFIYALLLGAGMGKLREILDCDESSATEAYDRLVERYTGFALLKSTIIPRDAQRGWFSGLDGRPVVIPGETPGARRHLAMSGYLQNGEAVVMKHATLLWHDKLKDFRAMLVNMVHDEWQTECPNNIEIALKIARMQAESLKTVGEQLGLRCPLAGSYWNDDDKDYTIATNWSKTH